MALKKQKTKITKHHTAKHRAVKKPRQKPHVLHVAENEEHPRIQTDLEYLYGRFHQLYLHSKHARHSFALLVLFKRNIKAERAELLKRQAAAETEYDLESNDSAWLHKPYPFSGHLRILTVVGIICAISIIVQIIYPSGLTLPLSRLDSNGYAGFKTQSNIEQIADNINHRYTDVLTKDSRVRATPIEMGVRADGERTFEKLSDYPIEKRLIPFSILFTKTKQEKVYREINVEKLSDFTKNIVTVTSREPKNAEVSLSGTKFVIVPGEDGYEYQQLLIQKQLAVAPLGTQPIDLSPKLNPPQITTYTAEQSVAEMQKRINAGFMISAGDQNLRIGPETVAAWVEINAKPELRTIHLSFNREKVIGSLKPLTTAVDKPGTPDQVTLLNGIEAGRKYGTSGETLQFDDLVNQVVSSTDWTVGLIQAKVATVPPKEVITRTYSKDSNGIQSLFDYWVKNNKGKYGIDMRSQNGKISANANSFKLFSGTHKLYLPHLAYGQITGRKISPGATTSTGYTVDGCIDKIVLSGHDGCTKAIGDIIGWGANNSMLAAQGLPDTTLSTGNGVTSANDASFYAMQLLNGSITTFSQRSGLISLMGEQSIRSGIPAGAKGTAVANRAGQSGSVRYDVAIVYHARGTYVLSIFTEGSSFAAIADLASQVNTVMGQ